LGVRASGVPSYTLPPPSVIASTLVESPGELARQVLPTILEAVLGLLLGVAGSVAAAVLTLRSKVFEFTVLPFTIVLQSVPIVAVTPLIALVVGRNVQTAIVAVAMVAFFPVLVNTVRGLASATSEERELMHVLAATSNQELRMLRLPTAVPFLFSGLRVAAALAIPAALVAEFTTSSQGLGYFIVSQAALFETELVWAAMVVATALTAGMFGVVVALERIVGAGHAGSEMQAS
jgi:ABC-type nitrate/sulfonate/bicarbonate transport system permease component